MTASTLYAAPILQFTQTDTSSILTPFPSEQNSQWSATIELLKQQIEQLPHLAGDVILEFTNQATTSVSSVIILYRGLVFVVAVGCKASDYQPEVLAALHQQANELKQHHLASERKFIIPVSIETHASPQGDAIVVSEDLVAQTMCDNGQHLAALIEHFSNQYKDDQIILSDWLASGFK
ncbi:hypothetical protein [Vibrio ouci]|uniref:Uncharacterized protein n=1 Tax=Vibrio ouci TaxID=2499078 RepID=A0A4Y8WFH4_9VIBR|nr:hypothetical protein [Vibrio ouci]TFH91413.1 hypothetical protein ELS82_12225 [Vibrio ouci]